MKLFSETATHLKLHLFLQLFEVYVYLAQNTHSLGLSNII